MKINNIKFKDFNKESNFNNTLIGATVIIVLVLFFSLLFIYPLAFFAILALGIVIYLIINVYNKQNESANPQKGSAFMTMMSLKNPVLLLSPKRRELTENYFKDLTDNKDSNQVKSSETYLDILNERYAKGEIDKDEYKRIRADIEK